jgi:DAK2 domain fusion protein YloV
MALTLESVVAGLDGTSGMPDVCQAISRGSLMGARGNSGVILSQILRGIADGCRDHDDVGAPELCAALSSASDAAYAAVMRPVEGTILTVVKAAAGGATKANAGGAATADGSLCGMFVSAREAGAVALANTPELLPVLKQAGVVDAGGAGFQLLLDSFLHVVDGRPLPEPDDVDQLAPVEYTPEIDAAHDSVSDLRYEVMYFLEAADETIPHFKNVWAGIGDSIVVVGGDGLWNCHIHTDDIGAAVEAALDAGRPRNIRVTDLIEQVEEERWVREAAVPDADPDVVPVPTAVVAVATGEGIRRIFRSLGVQQIVAGGQSMNPSTEQLLAAVEAAPADEVVILPNNKNIIPVAEQVDTLTDKAVRVVRTTGIAQGFAALLEYDPESTGDENAKAMEAAAGRVVSGEVTRAVRASVCDLGPIAEGDYLGITSDGIRAVAPVLADAVTALLDAIVTDDHEIVTLIEGEGAAAADTRRVTEWVHDNRPDANVEVHHGGQPLYPYLVSIE